MRCKRAYISIYRVGIICVPQLFSNCNKYSRTAQRIPLFSRKQPADCLHKCHYSNKMHCLIIPVPANADIHDVHKNAPTPTTILRGVNIFVPFALPFFPPVLPRRVGSPAFLKKGKGPYLCGEELTLADCSFAPKLYHASTCLAHFKNTVISPDLESLHKYM